MATATEAHDTHAEVDHGGHDGHPPDSYYFKVAGALAVMTAVEVALSYMGLSTTVLMLGLFPLMILKFATVAALFMHLKGDSKLFSRLFITGIILAFAVYAIVFFAFNQFA